MLNIEALYMERIREIKKAYKEKKSFHYKGVTYNVLVASERTLLVKTLLEHYMSDLSSSAIDDNWENQGELRRSLSLMQRMTNLLLIEELQDRNPYKVRHIEYPFLSGWQLMQRKKKEYPIALAEQMDCDGKDVSLPTRRRRTLQEELAMGSSMGKDRSFPA